MILRTCMEGTFLKKPDARHYETYRKKLSGIKMGAGLIFFVADHAVEKLADFVVVA